MEVTSLVMGLLALFCTVGCTAWVMWSNRNRKNNERIWERFDTLVTRSDMEKWVEVSQRPLVVKLDSISAELRGIVSRLN